MEAQGPSREAAVHTEIGRTNSTQLTLPEGSSSAPERPSQPDLPPGGTWSRRWGQGVPRFLGCAERVPRRGLLSHLSQNPEAQKHLQRLFSIQDTIKDCT